jgi:transposase
MNTQDNDKILVDRLQALEADVQLYKARCEQYEEAYDYLKEQLLELRRQRFGKKSERYLDDPESPQLSLLDDMYVNFVDEDTAGDKHSNQVTKVAAYSRKKNPKTTDALPRRVQIIQLADEDRQCSCGQCKNIIKYEVKELIHYQPSVLEILEQRREVAVCPKGCDGSMVTAPAQQQILPKIKATPEFLAHLAVSKLDDRQPLYHLERQLSERHGIDVSRQTMARWLIALTEPLQPIYNLLKEHIIDYNVASCDATTLQVLNEPGRAAETKSYVYCFRGGTPDKSVILYDYNASDHQQFLYNWFSGFNGYLHVDADNFFNLVGSNNATIVNCNAHARRKFEPIAQTNKGRGIAKEAMHYFKELYKVEREAKTQQLNADQRYELRQEKAKPIFEQFNSWIDKVYPTVLPKSTLGNAVNYCIKPSKRLNHSLSLVRTSYSVRQSEVLKRYACISD